MLGRLAERLAARRRVAPSGSFPESGMLRAHLLIVNGGC